MSRDGGPGTKPVLETRHWDERLKVLHEEGRVYIVTESHGGPIAEGVPPLLARRFVACWNACLGLSTKELEEVQDIHDLYNAVLRERERVQDDVEELDTLAADREKKP